MDTQVISEILVRLDNIEERLKKLETTDVPSINIEKKSLSIREFFLSKNANDEIQKTLLTCYYLENYAGLVCFNIKDIESGFRAAKEKLPKNINLNVYMNVKKGYIMEHTEKKDNMKSWVLTNSGSKFVESNFGNKGQ